MILRESHREGAPPREFFTGRTTLLFNAVSDPTNIIPIKPTTCGIEHSTTLGQTSGGLLCPRSDKIHLGTFTSCQFMRRNTQKWVMQRRGFMQLL